MDNEIKRLKEEIYHLQEKCDNEVEKAWKINSDQIYNLNMEINRIRKEVSRSDNLLAQHNLSEEDVNNILEEMRKSYYGEDKNDILEEIETEHKKR